MTPAPLPTLAEKLSSALKARIERYGATSIIELIVADTAIRSYDIDEKVKAEIVVRQINKKIGEIVASALRDAPAISDAPGMPADDGSALCDEVDRLRAENEKMKSRHLAEVDRVTRNALNATMESPYWNENDRGVARDILNFVRGMLSENKLPYIQPPEARDE